MANKEKKDQFIIAYLTRLDHSETVVSHALFLSKMLDKGLILLHISDPRYTDVSPEEAEPQLRQLKERLAAENGNLKISYCALKGDTQPIITALPNLLNAVAVTLEVDRHARRHDPRHRKQVLQNFSECKTAYLVAQEPLPHDSRMTDVALSMDFRKESKDKLIWSSYFARFGKANVHVLYYDYKDEFLHKKWYDNMTFMHKFYNSLNLTFQPHIMGKQSTFTDVNALRYAIEHHYNLLLTLTTKERDGIEMFIGVQEDRLIVNKEKLPILFLNPREDLYVLCD